MRIADEGHVAATVARGVQPHAALLGGPSRRGRAHAPNLACVWRRAADAAVVGLARELHWPRIKQLLAGLREPPPAATTPAATAVTTTTMPAAAAVGSGGCWLAVLDRELVLFIAETLVAMDSADAEA